MKHTVTVFRGDGIGPELVDNVLKILEAATFSAAGFVMILLLIAAGIYFFFRDGRRYWWQMGRQNGWPTPYRKYVYLNPGFILYVIIFGIEMISYIL